MIYIKVLLLEKHKRLTCSCTSMYETAEDWRYKCIKGSDMYIKVLLLEKDKHLTSSCTSMYEGEGKRKYVLRVISIY